MGASYYDCEDPFAIHRSLNDKSFTIDHLYVKLFRLPEMMNTDAGKLEARKRVDFMRSFVQQLQSEITPHLD